MSVRRVAADATQRREGSRFVTWQFCRKAAGGSREQPSGRYYPAASLTKVQFPIWAGHRRGRRITLLPKNASFQRSRHRFGV
jgi:hypothetical protein